MAALTAADINARQVMVTLAYHLVGRADHPVALAEEMSEFFAAVARMQRGSRVEPLRKRTPSGMTQAVAAVFEEAQAANNTLTKQSNITKLMAEADKGTHE